MNRWSNPEAGGRSEAQAMAAFLAARANTPDQQLLYAAVLVALAAQAGERILDAGCGPGLLTRRLAAAVGDCGLALGIDTSVTMIEVAAEAGPRPGLAFRTDDITALPEPDSSFDAACAVRLLLHVPAPDTVLRALHRVVRPGGRLVVLEWDWGTVAIDHPDRALTRRILDWRCDHQGGDNWMGRQLPRLCTAAGWQVRTIQPLVSVAQTANAALTGSLRRAAATTLADGAINATEHDRWLAVLDDRLATDRWFATINDYLVVADA